MEKLVFTREELYNLVWSEPMSRLAKKYNISDNGLRKICKKHSIPMPQLGYWQKIQYGYKVVKPKLPTITKDQGNINLRYRDDDGNYVESIKTPKSILKEEFLNNPKLPIIVSERLTNPDPLVVQAQNSLLPPKDGQNMSTSQLQIDVSKTSIPRALRFMDAFIKLFYARNHKIENQYGRLYGIINDVNFQFRLREKYIVTKVQNTYPNQIYSRSGIFVFSADPWGKKEWYDGKTSIEEKLVDIMIYIELKCKELSDIWAENERRRQIELEMERKIKEFLARKQAELEAVEDLLNQAIRLQQAEFMRDYVAIVEKNAENNITQNAELSDWLSWAKHKIDWYDPLIQVDDDLLDDDDRKALVQRLRKK